MSSWEWCKGRQSIPCHSSSCWEQFAYLYHPSLCLISVGIKATPQRIYWCSYFRVRVNIIIVLTASPLILGFLSGGEDRSWRSDSRRSLDTRLNTRTHTWDKVLPYLCCPLAFGEITWQWHSQVAKGDMRQEIAIVQKLSDKWQLDVVAPMMTTT